MTLVKTTTPGLWENPAWDQTKPGVFAMIIGVSEFSNLNNTEESYNLGQLQVSATTAYHFFDWLSNKYKLENVQVAKCWMLLSPTAEEIAQMAELEGHHIPTLANCEDAIASWFVTMQNLPDDISVKSRSLFFYSGHGLQVQHNKQVLLPQDYLSDTVKNVNKAISTANLSNGLRALKVPRHFFFLDACRDDNQKLNDLDEFRGAPILNEYKSSAFNKKSRIPILYGSESGAQAYQPGDPAKGISIFGRALVEGLIAKKNIKPECDGNNCIINLHILQKYLNVRIPKIIEAFGSTVDQLPVLGGEYIEDPLTEVNKPADISVTRSDSTREKYHSTKSVSDWKSADWSKGHEVFGHEWMTDIWINARTFSISNNGQIDDQSEQRLDINSVYRSVNDMSYKINFKSYGHDQVQWLAFRYRDKVYGAVLPMDGDRRPNYSLELEFFRNEQNGEAEIKSVSLNLSEEENPHNLKTAAAAWKMYKKMSTGTALQSDELKQLEQLVREKGGSPLGAVVGAIILVRALKYERLKNWLRNVANWFEYFSDGNILWIQQLLFQSEHDLLQADMTDGFMKDTPGGYWRGNEKKILDYLTELIDEGLPVTGESLSYADQIIDEFITYGNMEPSVKASLEHIQDKIKNALKYYLVGGLFCVYAGPEHVISPELVRFQ